MNETRFEVHTVQWTNEKSTRFWNYLSSRPFYQEIYFSRLVGDSVLKTVRRLGIGLRGRVLDFGCGPGYLIDKLVKNGIACEGADFSANSVRILNERLQRAKLFSGAHHIEALPSALESGSYDTVLFIETIEHLLDDDLDETVSELHRILRPGGTLIVTTPNDEDLDRNEAFCPDCGCSFNRIQHVRRWTDQTLTDFFSRRGFRRFAARICFFRPSWLGTIAFTLAARLTQRKLPNLVWAGVRE